MEDFMCSRATKTLVAACLFCQSLAAGDIWTTPAKVGTKAIKSMPVLHRGAQGDPTASPSDARSVGKRYDVVEAIETHMQKTVNGTEFESYVTANPGHFQSTTTELTPIHPPVPRGEILEDETLQDDVFAVPAPYELPTNILPETPLLEKSQSTPPAVVRLEEECLESLPAEEPTPLVTHLEPQHISDPGQCLSCSGGLDTSECTCFGFSCADDVYPDVYSRDACSGIGGASDWEFGGWLAGGSTINAHGNRTPVGNAPLGFNNYANGAVLNQAWLYAGKSADTGGCGFDWGCRIDFMFGADGPDTQAFGDGGWDESWDTSSQYGFAMPQYYGELAWDRLTTRIGHFYTIIGYEVVQAPDNFFYSHSYTMYYNEPFTHTGVLAQYDWSDNITLWGGWTAGWDSGFGNRNDGSTFLGGASWSFDTVTFIYATTFGDPGDGANSDVYMHSLIADYALTDQLNYVVQSDYQTRNTAGARANSYGINQYLLYNLASDLSVGARLEWFNDAAGARIGNGPGDYWALSLGTNYLPYDNWILRNEVRWDWFDGAGSPFDNNTERSQFTLGTSVVFVF